jgi:HEPN superfamily AbiU2-like protein
MVVNRYIERMGDPLGTQFFALWQEVAWLHMKWAESVELFGSIPTRTELLNQAAPAFFHMIQIVLWEDTLLHIARVTDVSTSGGKNQKANLTIQNLPGLVSDPNTRQIVAALVETAVSKAKFCRDWRNRHIAHRDLNLALNQSTPLQMASRKLVDEALCAIANVLNEVDGHYMDSSTHFIGGHSIGSAVSLLHVLDDRLRAKAARSERLLRGEFSEQDYPRSL